MRDGGRQRNLTGREGDEEVFGVKKPITPPLLSSL
jgi:hypothetical protein